MKRFFKVAKLSTGAVFVAVTILICYTVVTKEDEIIELPFILGIYCVISIIAFVICILIAMVLEFIENIRRDTSYPVWYGLTTVLFWLVLVAIDYFLIRIVLIGLPVWERLLA